MTEEGASYTLRTVQMGLWELGIRKYEQLEGHDAGAAIIKYTMVDLCLHCTKVVVTQGLSLNPHESKVPDEDPDSNDKRYGYHMNEKPGRWWIAGLFSLIWPGLGQVYNGQGRKGLLILALPLLSIPGMILCLDGENIAPFLGAYVLLGLAYYAAAVWDAISTARKLREGRRLKKYNRVAVYIGIVTLMFALNSVLSILVKNNYLKAYRIPAGSMKPALLIGDHILVDRRPEARSPKRGELIVFEYPVDPEKDFIKRVVATGGDTVEIREKELLINNEPVHESYVIHNDPRILPIGKTKRDSYGPVTVPPDSYFVLGDNRDESYDSRFWGFVEKSRVKGTVTNIYWSWDSEKGSVRWSRIGTKVR